MGQRLHGRGEREIRRSLEDLWHLLRGDLGWILDPISPVVILRVRGHLSNLEGFRWPLVHVLAVPGEHASLDGFRAVAAVLVLLPNMKKNLSEGSK